MRSKVKFSIFFSRNPFLLAKHTTGIPNYALQVLIRCLIGFESWRKALMCLYGLLFLLLVAETLLNLLAPQFYI
jgi:hypothetical protein